MILFMDKDDDPDRLRILSLKSELREASKIIWQLVNELGGSAKLSTHNIPPDWELFTYYDESGNLILTARTAPAP